MARSRLIPTVFLASALLPGLTGCLSIQPALTLAPASMPSHRPEAPASATQPRPSADQPTQPAQPADAQAPDRNRPRWPDRWGQPDAPRGVIVPSPFGPAQLRPAHLGRFHTLRLGNAEYLHATALAEALGIEDGFRFEAEGPGSLVFLPPLDPEEQPQNPAADDPFESVVFVSARLIERKNDEDRVALERTWIANYDALTDNPKGTIVMIPGMLGTPQPIIEGMIRYWCRAGYAVVRLLSHPSRFTERVEVPVTPGNVTEAATLLASIYDQRTAECAYAADAAIRHFHAARPAMKDKPVVLLGMSGGAMVLPTVYAYAPDNYDAAVLIAGGADFLTISATSNYAEWIDAIALDWAPDDPNSTGKPDPATLETLSDAYLAASRLDAMHTAPLMTVPRLVLHSSKDRAVPSQTGDALWQRLGRPERWTYSVGHELIFIMLPTQADRLQKWIDAAIAPAGQDE